MRLFYFEASPNPLKVRLALQELGVPCELKRVNLFAGEQRLADFQGLTPLGQVPVLQDGSLTLRESNAILAYLGKEYGKDLWPKGAAAEAEALQWLFFESCDLVNRCGRLWWADIVFPVVGRRPVDDAKVAATIEELERPLDFLEAHFQKHPFVLGSDFSLVDCSLGVTLNLLRGTRGDKRTRWPHVVEYRERIRGRRSWSESEGDAPHNPRAAVGRG